MFIEYEHEENYILASPDWVQLNQKTLPEFIDSISESIADFPHLILNLSSLAYYGEEASAFFEAVLSQIKQLKGTLVVAETVEHIAAQLEEKGINCVPTNEEAIDFMYMEQIERSLYNEEGQEGEE